MRRKRWIHRDSSVAWRLPQNDKSFMIPNRPLESALGPDTLGHTPRATGTDVVVRRLGFGGDSAPKAGTNTKSPPRDDGSELFLIRHAAAQSTKIDPRGVKGSL
jgi:hypothetical protein